MKFTGDSEVGKFMQKRIQAKLQSDDLLGSDFVDESLSAYLTALLGQASARVALDLRPACLPSICASPVMTSQRERGTHHFPLGLCPQDPSAVDMQAHICEFFKDDELSITLVRWRRVLAG